MRQKVLLAASVASMIDQFNMPNIRLLQELGYEVHVTCNFKEGNTCDRQKISHLIDTFRETNVRWHQWDCPRSICSVRRCVKAYRQIVHLLKREHYRWIHCHSPVGGALARAAAHRIQIPAVYTAHGFHFYQGAPVKNWLLYYPAEKLLAHWTDVLITVNQEDYRLAVSNLKAGKVFRIPGIGIDVDKFAPAVDTEGCREKFRDKYGIPQDAVLLLSVGELSRRKNHRLVISALAGLAGRDLYYLICGQGKLKDALMYYAEKRGVAERLRLAGFQDDMDKIYRSADLFVFPSLQEGLSAALMEAMASGLACIVSDIRGNRELIDSRGGRVFQPGNVRQLQAAVEELAADAQLRYRQGCYNRQKIKNYSLWKTEKKMKEIYLEVRSNEIEFFTNENKV